MHFGELAASMLHQVWHRRVAKIETRSMLNDLGGQDRSERDEIIAHIQAAFADVTRGDRGIWWSECVAIDKYETENVCEAARLSDTDSPWSELVDKLDWQPFPGIGGLRFINAEGFRYYLPPTMIRFLRGDNSEWFPGHLLLHTSCRSDTKFHRVGRDHRQRAWSSRLRGFIGGDGCSVHTVLAMSRARAVFDDAAEPLLDAVVVALRRWSRCSRE